MRLGIAVISTLNTKWAKTNIVDNMSSVDYVKNLVDNIYAERVWHFINEDELDKPFYESIFNSYSMVKKDVYSFLTKCIEVFNKQDTILIIYTDSPLNSIDLIKHLLDLHQKEMTEYTFTENYPNGIGAEVISYATLEKLKNISSGNNSTFTKNSISKLINLDINHYDVDVLISQKDVRKERLSLTCDSYLNYMVVKGFIDKLYELGYDISTDNIYSIIDDYPQLMRTIPAYVEIEITNDCNSSCDICPRTNIMDRPIRNMTLDEYKQIVNGLKDMCDELTIALTLMGEPTLHPNIVDIIDFSLSIKGITLILETNGLLLDNVMVDNIMKLKTDNLIIIVALDSPNAELYKEIRGIDGFKTVEDNISYILNKFAKNTYLQIIRLRDNNDLLDLYYKRWNQYKDHIIMQKYNSYRNDLSDLKAVDLSPLRRFSCWHLKRDMLILSNGTVPFCKQDINGIKAVGNAFEEGVKVLWQNLEKAFIDDHNDNINDFCKNCDEWFTYNF